MLGSLKGLGVGWLLVDLEWPQKSRAFLEVGFHQAHVVHIVGREGRCEPCLLRLGVELQTVICAALCIGQSKSQGQHQFKTWGNRLQPLMGRAAKLPCKGHGYREGKELRVLLQSTYCSYYSHFVLIICFNNGTDKDILLFPR